MDRNRLLEAQIMSSCETNEAGWGGTVEGTRGPTFGYG